MNWSVAGAGQARPDRKGRERFVEPDPKRMPRVKLDDRCRKCSQQTFSSTLPPTEPEPVRGGAEAVGARSLTASGCSSATGFEGIDGEGRWNRWFGGIAPTHSDSDGGLTAKTAGSGIGKVRNTLTAPNALLGQLPALGLGHGPLRCLEAGQRNRPRRRTRRCTWRPAGGAARVAVRRVRPRCQLVWRRCRQSTNRTHSTAAAG